MRSRVNWAVLTDDRGRRGPARRRWTSTVSMTTCSASASLVSRRAHVGRAGRRWARMRHSRHAASSGAPTATTTMAPPITATRRAGRVVEGGEAERIGAAERRSRRASAQPEGQRRCRRWPARRRGPTARRASASTSAMSPRLPCDGTLRPMTERDAVTRVGCATRSPTCRARCPRTCCRWRSGTALDVPAATDGTGRGARPGASHRRRRVRARHRRRVRRRSCPLGWPGSRSESRSTSTRSSGSPSRRRSPTKQRAIEAGWPAMGSEIVPGETIPAETGITDAAVDFKKGCYPGQELVERMDSRGADAPRRLRILDVADGAEAGRPGRARRPSSRRADQRRRAPRPRLRQARRRPRHRPAMTR